MLDAKAYEAVKRKENFRFFIFKPSQRLFYRLKILIKAGA